MINIPKNKNREPSNNPIDLMLSCSNSTNAIRIITPAENPIINEMNFGLGFFIKKATKLPIVVDKPANKLNKRARI
jgi:serine protease inhibitor ecotin